MIWILLYAIRTCEATPIHTVKLLIHNESLLLAVEHDVAVNTLWHLLTIVPLYQLPCDMYIGWSNSKGLHHSPQRSGRC